MEYASAVTIAVPLLNGGRRFRALCSVLSDTEFDGQLDLLCIDSGSNDTSVEFAQKAGFRVHRIAQSEFGHGKTRNLACQLSASPFVVFLTQDAIPSSKDWLSELLKPLLEDEQVAGVYGRHIAYPEHGPFTARDLDAHFENRRNFLRVSKKSLPNFDDSPKERFQASFFSSNCAAIRRATWQDCPIPDVDFGEDQAWALAALRAGWTIAYEARAVVFHSHEYGLRSAYERAKEEARAISETTGFELSPTMIGTLLRGVRSSFLDIGFAIRQPGKIGMSALWMRIGQNFGRAFGHYMALK